MFRAYVKVADQHYRESFGLDFEDFKIGQKFRHRPGLTISQQDNKEEALDTINNTQLHYDAFYASQTEWKKNLGVSTLTLQRVLGMTTKTFFKRYRIVKFEDIAMTHPVFGGDTLYAETEILEVGEYPNNPELGYVKACTQGLNQDKAVVTKVTYTSLIYKKGLHPLDKIKKFAHVEDQRFQSHILTEDGFYLEEVGLYYEDLMPGEIYDHRPGKTFTSEEHRLHMLRSLEINPEFSDQHYIKSFFDGKERIHDVFVLGVCTNLTTRTFDRVVANLGWNNTTMHREVYVGDTLYARSKILDKRESKSRPTQGIMHAFTEVYNQNEVLVCDFERHFLIYKKGTGPYAAAGY